MLMKDIHGFMTEASYDGCKSVLHKSSGLCGWWAQEES